MMMRINSLLLLATFLAGCATAPPPVVVPPAPLPLPALPDLPRIPSAELQCLSDSAYTALVERDAKLNAYVLQLRAIIEETRK